MSSQSFSYAATYNSSKEKGNTETFPQKTNVTSIYMFLEPK